MITSLEHACIFVRYFSRSVSFYQDLLGGTVVREAAVSSSKTRIACLQFGTGIIELIGGEGLQFGYNHVAFGVDDLDKTYEELSRSGIVFSTTPRAAGSGIGRVAFFSDPDGLRMELVAQPKFSKDPRTLESHPIFSGLDHVSVQVNNMTSSLDFYRTYLHCKVVKKSEIEAKKLAVVYLECGVNIIELVHQPFASATGPKRIRHVALRVDDLNASVRALQSKGCEIKERPAGTCLRDGLVMTFLDSEGNEIEMLEGDDVRRL